MSTISIYHNGLKSKSPGKCQNSLSVDRGGVKPLEQNGKSTPENRSDSALIHEVDIISIYANRKALLRELFGATNNLDRSRLTILAISIAWRLSTCQISENPLKIAQDFEPPSDRPRGSLSRAERFRRF